MVDLFEKQGIAPPKDIFASAGIAPPTVEKLNQDALSPLPVSEAPQELQAEEESHRSDVERLASSRFSEEEIQAMKDKGEIGFWEAGDFLDANQVLPGGGVSQGVDLFRINGAANKIEAGEELTESETELMNNFIDKHVETNLRGFSIGGGISYYGAQTPAFMVEFALTGGIGKAAQKGVQEAVKKVVTKGVTAKVASKTLGVTANVAARSVALMPTRYTPKYAELRVNDHMAITDKGALLFKESKESPAISAVKAFGYLTAEVASEVSGVAIGKYITKPAGRVVGNALKTPIQAGLSKIPIAVRDNLYKAYKTIKPNATISRAFSRAGWHGMLEELGEERVGDILRASLDMSIDEDFTFQDYMDAITPTSDQLLIEAGIISIAGGVKASADMAMNIITKKNGGDRAKAQETVDNMSATEQEAFVERELTRKPVRGFHGTSADIETFQTDGGTTKSSGTGAFFSSSPQVAATYATGNSPALYPVDLDLESPATVDFGGAVWNSANVKDLVVNLPDGTQKNLSDHFDAEGDGQVSTDDIARLIRSNAEGWGVDSAVFENVVDRGGAGRFITPESRSPSSVFVAFDPSQIHFTSLADPISQSQAEAVKEQEPPQINHEESGFNRFYRDFINGLQPIQDITEGAKKKGAEIKTGENPFLLSRTYAGVIGQIEHNLQHGTTRLDPETGQFEVTGKAMKQILDDFDNSVANIETNRDQREIDFNDFLIARRTLEDLVPREDVKVSAEDALAAGETMSRLASKYENELRWFDTFALEMYEYQRRVLSNLVDSGVMSQEQFDTIVENNPNYIPFQRVLEEEHFAGSVSAKGVFTDANSRDVIKKIQGSGLDIKATTHSVIANTAKIVDIAYRNRVSVGVAGLADVMPEYIQKVKTPMNKITVKDPKGGEDIVTYRPSELQPHGTIVAYVDGKKQFYEVSQPLLEAMNNLSPAQMNATSKILGWPFRTTATLLRAGATLIPEFWIRNVIRDQGTAILQSPVRPTPIDMVKGLASVMGNGQLYQEWMRNGGSFNSYMDLDDKGLEKSYKELFRPSGKFARYTRNPINILADISQTLEQGTRVGAFSKAKKAGIVGIEAALMSREATLDFARGGATAKGINRYIPFFNAGVQSVDKLARVAKENPKALMLWGTATITVPSVLLTGYYLYGAPEEERKEYLELPQWQKDMFWVFKENGEWRRVPKPFSFGYVFGSVPERFMIWGYEGDKPEMKSFWEELAVGVVGSISPIHDISSALTPLLKVLIEDTANYNFFTGRDIHPDWMNDLVPEKRSNKYTSETAKAIGEKLGVSPAKIDHTLRGLLAGSSRYVTDAGDMLLNQVKEWNGEVVPERPVTPSDVPIIKAFSVREPTGYGTNSVANFFDDWKKVSEVHATFKTLEGEERQEFREKNTQLLRAYKPMKSFQKRIRTFGKRADRIYKDEAMTADEKVEALSENGQLILDAAISANKWYKENIKGK